MYRVLFSKTSEKQLRKLDKSTATIILAWLRKNLEGCQNPRIHGKPFSANRVGQWRYRVGDYRLICEIRDNELIVLVITVGHRREIYGSR